MTRPHHSIAHWLPMTWAVDVVRDLMSSATLSGGSWWRVGGLALAAMLALFVASCSMRRQTR